MARALIVVGAGNCWTDLVQPSSKSLQQLGLIGDIVTVDIVPKDQGAVSRHVIREQGQDLSNLIDGLGYPEPYVILSHPNQLHTPDAKELVEYSQSNPRILIEKPYATDSQQMMDLENLIGSGQSKIGLLEYYLTMKAIPLLLFGGVVDNNSFYFENNGILKMRAEGKLTDYSGRLEDTIGKPLFVVSEILEGEGKFGTIAHRNIDLVDKVNGGGMIQDLGQHAITSLMALSGHIGQIKFVRDVKIAYCEEYVEFAKKNNVDDSRIAESYAEIDFETTTGVPVHVSLGKYVENGTNQRRILIAGTRGVILYDLTNNILGLQKGDDNSRVRPLIEADKVGMPRYLAVLRAGMETLEGRSPFKFDPVKVAFDAQGLIFEVLNKEPSARRNYADGAMHDTIF